MKSFSEELWLEVPSRRGFVNIAGQVEQYLRESGASESLVLVNAIHITASVFINDDESGLHHDYEKWLEGLAPHGRTTQYRHNRTGEDNADAHLKRRPARGRTSILRWSPMIRLRIRPLRFERLRQSILNR